MNISNHSDKLPPPINLCNNNHKTKSTTSTDKTVCSSTTTTTTTTSATACGDSILTRTPSPMNGDIITSSHVQVIMDGLGNKKIPPLSSSSSSSPRTSYITYDANSCSLMNDDTDHTIDSTAAAADIPQSREEADREDDEENLMIPRGLPPS